MITLILAAACGVLGTVQYEQHNDIRAIRSSQTELRQGYNNHEERLTAAEDTLVKHRRGLDYLHDKIEAPKPTSQRIAGVPTDDWMERLGK